MPQQEIIDCMALIPDGDALVIVPPFALADRPSLAAHLLQACARAAGPSVRVLYANLTLASLIGKMSYRTLSEKTTRQLLGERFFAAAAYEAPPLGGCSDLIASAGVPCQRPPGANAGEMDLAELQRHEAKATSWADAIAAAVAGRAFKVVGCTTTFEQTSASVALLNRIKRLRPDILTVLGGANCEGPMAEGIASLGAAIDYIFSGESDRSFPRFLNQVLSGHRPAQRIITGEPCHHLDDLPTPMYAEFFEQRERCLPTDPTIQEKLWLPYETSRGCWWGQKHHCTFCGLNGLTMTFRAKSPDRVIHDLRQLVAEHPSRHITMVDNIMPHPYFRTLIPRLATEVPNLDIFYEQKANLSLEQVLALKKAGVRTVQPGIEALSSSLLRRMRKGVSAAQNLALLRYGASAHLGLFWNLLLDFPGDQVQDYTETLALLPLLRHLPPPSGPCPLRIDRFSPYFERPGDFGVSDLQPLETYHRIFPPHAKVAKLAYFFTGHYRSAAREHPDLVRAVEKEVGDWRKSWQDPERAVPMLRVRRLASQVFILQDTRALPGTREAQFLTREEASLALVGKPLLGTPEAAWALERKLGAFVDGAYVPLATAEPELLLEFESGLPAGGSRVGAERPGRLPQIEYW